MAIFVSINIICERVNTHVMLCALFHLGMNVNLLNTYQSIAYSFCSLLTYKYNLLNYWRLITCVLVFLVILDYDLTFCSWSLKHLCLIHAMIANPNSYGSFPNGVKKKCFKDQYVRNAKCQVRQTTRKRVIAINLYGDKSLRTVLTRL